MANLHPSRCTESGSSRLASARRPFHGVLAVVAVLGLAFLSQPGVAFAQMPVLDQSHNAASISTANFSGVFRRGQIFTVGVTGTLAHIEVAVSGTNVSLEMDLMSVTAGLPDSVLATATNPTDVAAGVKSFDFTGAGVFATANSTLAFVLADATNPAGLTNTADSYVGGSRVSSNDGGSSWILNPTDSNFSTYVLPSPVQPNLITNGSFENGADPGAFLFALPAGDTSIDDWTIATDNIDYIGTQWTASDGARSIDLSGAGGFGGSIIQTVPTEVGTEYVLVFDLAGNPGGSQGVKDVRILASGRDVNFAFDTTGRSLTDMGWVTHTLPFTATSTSTTITFESLTTSGFGPALDNVRVQEDLISNGSFDVGPDPGGFIRVGGTTIPGWTIDFAAIDYIGTTWVASDGARSLDLAGASPGAIYQDIATVPGGLYTLFFDLAGNPSGGPTVKILRSFTPAGLTDFSFDVTGRSVGDMGWRTESFPFRATGSVSRVRFNTVSGGSYGPALDNVHVIALAPPTNGELDTDRDGIADTRDKCPTDPTPHVYVASDDQTTASFPEDFTSPRAERTELRFTRGAIPEGFDGGPQYLVCEINFGSIAGGEGRITHLQDIALIGDRSDGAAQIFASHSQNFGGQLFVLESEADAPPNEEGAVDVGLVGGEGIWYRKLDDLSEEGPYNHPGDLSLVGDIVAVAGQNWDGGPGVDLFGQPFLNVCQGQLLRRLTRQLQPTVGDPIDVAEPDAILFYDASDPTFPEYLGKVLIAQLPLHPDESLDPYPYGEFGGFTAARVGDHVYMDVAGRWFRSTWMSWHADDWVPVLQQNVPVIPARGFARVWDATLEANSWGVNITDPATPNLFCIGSVCSYLNPGVVYSVERIGSLPAQRTFDVESEIVDCATEPSGPFTRDFVGCRAGEMDMFVSSSGRMQLAIAEPGFGASDYCSLAGGPDNALCAGSLLVESYTNAPVAQVGWAGGTPQPLPEAACQAPRFSVADALQLGDGLVTRDHTTDFDWLDLSATAGMSPEAILAGADDWSTMGWRYATAVEVCELLEGATEGFGIDCGSLDPFAAQSASGAHTPARFDGLLANLGFTRATIGAGDAYGPESGGQGGPIVDFGFGSIDALGHVDVGNDLGDPGYQLLPCEPDAETGWCEAAGLYDRGDGSYAMASASRGLAKCNDVDLRECQEGMIFGFTNQPLQSTCKKCALMHDLEFCGPAGCAADQDYPGAGSFLVRPVPEPRVGLLLSSGALLLLGWARRRLRFIALLRAHEASAQPAPGA